MKKFGIIILTLLISYSFASAQEVPLTLDEAVAIALRDNRDILISAQGIEKAKAQIKEAWAEIFPALDFSTTRLTTQNLRPEPYNTMEIHAGLQQIIFASGRIINTIQYNEYGRQVQQALLNKTKLETVLSVKEAFCTLILSAELYKVNYQMLENIQQHLDFLRQRYQNGQASGSDILNAQASLSAVKKECEGSLNQVEAAENLLKKLLYLQESVKIKASGEFIYEPLEIVYDKAILEAMSRRPEIKQYEAQAKADQKAVNVARTGNLPSIYATWDEYSGDKFLTATGGSNKWKNYNVYGFTFSWPIFDGLATQARIEQAIVGLKETKLTQEKTIKDIALEVKNSYLSLKDAIAKIEASEADLKFYSDNLSTVKEKYTEGITSILDVSDANLKYALSAFNKQQALYDYIVAKSAFEKATGGTYASAK